jgi:hypothetical protein
MSEEVAIQVAAKQLGITEWAVRKAVLRGELKELPGPGPARLDAAEVVRFRQARQDAALRRLAAAGTDLVQLARDTRAYLQPYPGTAVGKVAHVGPDVVAAFGAPVLHGASVWKGCSWCATEMAGRLLHVPVRPSMLCSEIGLVLLGAPECADHRALVRGRMTELAARVHAGGGRPAGGRSVPSAGKRPPAPPQAAQGAVTAAAPVAPDDNGRALVARRLREVRARLKDAKRSGDQRYAIKLKSMVASLEADAAVVDGRRTFSAADRPGTLRCGHLLASNCACPRRAPKRSA